MFAEKWKNFKKIFAHLFLLTSLKLTDSSKKNKIIHSFLSEGVREKKRELWSRLRGKQALNKNGNKWILQRVNNCMLLNPQILACMFHLTIAQRLMSGTVTHNFQGHTVTYMSLPIDGKRKVFLAE